MAFKVIGGIESVGTEGNKAAISTSTEISCDIEIEG
jgi:hypothetical protein